MNPENENIDFEPREIVAIAADIAAILNYTAPGSAPAKFQIIDELTSAQRQIVRNRLRELGDTLDQGQEGD